MKIIKNIKSIVITGCILVVFFSPSSAAQSQEELEKRFENIQVQMAKEQQLTDSLNNILTQRVKEIDKEKSKKTPDEEKIVQLMSSSASVSNNIDVHQDKLNDLRQKRNQLAVRLSGLYNSKIDSLRKLEEAGKKDPEEIETEILYYTEKRLLVEPGIQNLSFNPARILNFDMSRLKDKKEKAAYADYLQNALKEVNTLLADVTEKNSEVSEVLQLQKKTQKFLKEIEFEGRPGTRRSSAGIKTSSSNDGQGRGGAGAFTGNETITDVLNSQVAAYNSVLTQLAFDKSVSANLKWDINLDKGRNYDLNDYKDLLTELKRNLQEYKEVLRNKLDSVN